MTSLRSCLDSVRGRQRARRPLAAPALCLLCGLVLGCVIKLLDLHTQNLGNIFSQVSVWIALCSVLAGQSASPLRAALHVLLLSLGMLAAYYLTAILTHSFYALSAAYGWAAFALFTPPMAALAWYAKGRGPLAVLLRLGILAVMAASAILLFDRLRLSDLLLMLALILYFFREKQHDPR